MSGICELLFSPNVQTVYNQIRFSGITINLSQEQNVLVVIYLICVWVNQICAVLLHCVLAWGSTKNPEFLQNISETSYRPKYVWRNH